jgi:hypothetical protein
VVEFLHGAQGSPKVGTTTRRDDRIRDQTRHHLRAHQATQEQPDALSLIHPCRRLRDTTHVPHGLYRVPKSPARLLDPRGDGVVARHVREVRIQDPRKSSVGKDARSAVTVSRRPFLPRGAIFLSWARETRAIAPPWRVPGARGQAVREPAVRAADPSPRECASPGSANSHRTATNPGVAGNGVR